MKTILLITLLLASGCATTYPKIELKDEDFADRPVSIINTVPFTEQTPQLCGPTALYMVSKPLLPKLSLEEVSKITFTPAALGSFKQDMLAGARRLGLAPYKIIDLPQIIGALSEGDPVLIFHRTSFLWKNFWHYSVITGYNRLQEKFYLHIGPYAYREASISDVIGSWEEGGRWAYIVRTPGDIPETASFQETIDNSLAFLRLGFDDEAQSLTEQILKRWPNRFEGDVVMAEVLLKKKEKRKALSSLKRAFLKKPDNLALKRKIDELSRAI